MNCPIDGCDAAVEPGPNTYVEVELGTEKIKKLVCDDCADMIAGYLK